MGEVIRLNDRPKYKERLKEELRQLDAEIEPKQRRAEEIRRVLGVIGVEKGLEEDEL